MIGQFFTPEIVARFMYRMARIRRGQRIMDPSCGDGVFLKTCPKGCNLFACEVDKRYHSVIGTLLPYDHLVSGDALVDLAPYWGTFDLAIGNPPFSAQTRLERRAMVLKDFDLATGRRSQCLEVLFLELFLKLAKPGGRIVIILPDGPLSNGPFAYVRSWLLCRAHVEIIVSLPRNIFPGTSAKTNILIAQKRTPSKQTDQQLTLLQTCNQLADLEKFHVPQNARYKQSWKSIVLAEVNDWRPEARMNHCSMNKKANLRLDAVCRLRTGFALYGKQRELHDQPSQNRVLLLRAKNLLPNGGLRLSRDRAFIQQNGEMHREKAMVQPGEILFVRVGVGCYGRTALAPPRLRAQADDWLHILTPLVDLDAQGLVDWFNSVEGRFQVQRLAKGVGTLSISKSSLAGLQIPARFANVLNSNELRLQAKFI